MIIGNAVHERTEIGDGRVVGEGRDRGPFERRGVDVDRLELSATLECRVDEVRSFEDADALAPAQRTFLDESPESTNPLM